MKNILFIIESSETGGAENMFLELVLRIDRSRFNPHVALLYEGWLSERFRENGIVPHMIPTGKGGFDIRLLKGIRKLLEKNSIDLIHSHLFTTNVYASVCGALASIPVISTFHGTMDVDMTDSMKKLKWWLINRFSTKIVFVSRYLLEYFVSKNLARPSKSLVIHNGIDVERFSKCSTKIDARRYLGIPIDCFIIGCVGDLRPAKDYETALRAMSQLKEHIPSIKLVIAGSKTALLNDLLALSQALGIDKDVYFLGFRPDIENVLPAFDVYLSSSISEGFSLTVVEAMAAGIPVIATCSGGPEEIIKNGQNGLLVSTEQPSEIVRAVECINRNGDFAVKLSEEGRRSAEKNFSIKNMVAKYQSIYFARHCI